MENNKYEIQDLINAAVEQKPTNFSDIFGNLLVDRLSDAVSNKKMELAKSMYGSAAEVESDENDYEDNSEEETYGETA
jgi:hypothetical protein